MRNFTFIVSSEDKHHVFSLESNCKHNCRTKMDAASSDRPFSPPTKFSMPRLTCRDNFLQFIFIEAKVSISITIYKNNWTNKAHTASFDRLYFPATSFKRMEENINFSWTIVFRTKLFFWQVCVCSAKGDTPLNPRFSFLSASSLIESSCHFSFFSLVSEHSALRF